jgi:CDGSH-type Zn-finger protein
VSKEEAASARTQISVVDGGPLVVRGPVLVTDADGGEFRIRRKAVLLCRCGASRNKPFCDGTHAKIGFRASERAARMDGGERAGRDDRVTSGRPRNVARYLLGDTRC